VFTWSKLGNVFDPSAYADLLWTKQFAQSPSVLIYSDKVRVYFCSRPAPGPDGLFVSFMSYFDLDRADLTKVVATCEAPILHLGGFGAFDEFGTNPVSVIRDGSEVRAYYAGWTRCESVPFNAAIGLAISRDDGNSFERLGPGPVLAYSPDEPFLLGSPRIRKFRDLWTLWYVSGRRWIATETRPEPVYKLRMARSSDGIRWSREGRDLLPDVLGPDECQACADVIWRAGQYHMFFSYRQSLNYTTREGGYRMGYAVSDDCLHWTRRDELIGLFPSESGWDSEMVSYPHVFELDGQVYMLYQGNGMGRTGIGLARLDGTTGWAF
jgi:hypothetical protein